MILEKIKKPNDIHKIPLEDFEPLAAEIRDFLIRSVSQTGGHLASNLGVVELTLALHNVLDFPEDKLIWDVGVFKSLKIFSDTVFCDLKHFT